MKQIPLTQGQFAIVDDADFAELSKYKWYAKHEPHTWYAMRDTGSRTHKIRIRMHRYLLGAASCQDVDHINSNGLDNRKINLRLCTRSENIRNARKRTNCSSLYKGVHWHKTGCKWQSKIYVNGSSISLGLYEYEQEAAKAYDSAAIKYFGEFANINFKREEVA